MSTYKYNLNKPASILLALKILLTAIYGIWKLYLKNPENLKTYKFEHMNVFQLELIK